MKRKERLLRRLDEIGLSLERTQGALLLLGLGSVGNELDRLDEFSDLDFFVIVKPGYKTRFIELLDWISASHPIDYAFKNSRDGYKILFSDGIYGEFAVFEEQELENISYSEGRIVWKKSSFDDSKIPSSQVQKRNVNEVSLDFSINEALTNLYVGLCRYARGEKLSALRFIEGHAINSILKVLYLLEKEVDYFPDAFANERRLENRFPRFAVKLEHMLQGYNRVPESANVILEYIESVHPINKQMCNEVRRLIKLCLHM
ncbi:hypothetical protein HF078_05535 [Bacillus sp. RO2]|uniref:hypothetical protein n=1 Tax=Bacillus sp. RO2 TaxID=2723913 RepID=UPI00145C6167|nr:hypothetical protein [Bacillus sp. RO2]NMH72530.1 hypothetical protein [Bacillus sp. RO2]